MRIFALTPSALQRTLGFFGSDRKVISLVGGGGKSTVMYFAAHTCAKQGKRVLVTTTTNIFMPDPGLYAETPAQAEQLWQQGKVAVIGTPMPGKGKLKMPGDDLLYALLPRADMVFIEADGSKHYPCKVPREGEPVLLPESDTVLAVLGLSAIGKPIREVCFRLPEVQRLLGVEEDHILTEEDAAWILWSSFGSRKDVGERNYCVVLNQCDDGPRRRAGNLIAAFLAEYGVTQVVMTAFDPAEREKYNRMAGAI